MDNEYVMRFAIDGDASKRLLCEIIVRDVIRRSTRSAVPVPRFVATERWGTHQHLSFTLDEKLHGSAEMADITTRTERDLVTLFDSLKSCVCVCV